MPDKKVKIFSSGRELFYSKGFKETSVSDITKLAGIAIGTFYNFYPSKEKLFLEIYMKENEKFKKLLMDSINLNDDPVTAAKKFIERLNDAMKTNLILKEWYNRDFFSELEEYYHKEEIKNNNFIDNALAELLKKWRAEGKIRDDIDNELIMAIFESLAYIDTHKEAIGIHHFPQIMQYLVEFIMKGLTDCKR